MRTPPSKANARLASDVNPEESQDYAAKRSSLDEETDPVSTPSLVSLLNQLVCYGDARITKEVFSGWIQLFARLILEQSEPVNAFVVANVLSSLRNVCAGASRHNGPQFNKIASHCLSQDVIVSVVAQCSSQLDNIGIVDLVRGLKQLRDNGWIASGAQIPTKTWLEKMYDLQGGTLLTFYDYGNFLLHFEQLAKEKFFSDLQDISSDLIIKLFEKLIALAERPGVEKVSVFLNNAMTNLNKLFANALFDNQDKISAALVERVLSLAVGDHQRSPHTFSSLLKNIVDCDPYIEWGGGKAIKAQILDQFLLIAPSYSVDIPGVMLGIGKLCKAGHVDGRIMALVKFSELAEQLYQDRALELRSSVSQRIAMFLRGAGEIVKYNEAHHPEGAVQYNVKCVAEDDLFFLLRVLYEDLPARKVITPMDFRQIGNALLGVYNLIHCIDIKDNDKVSRRQDFIGLVCALIDRFLSLPDSLYRDDDYYFFHHFSTAMLGAGALVERFPDCDRYRGDRYKEQLTRQVIEILKMVSRSRTNNPQGIIGLCSGITAFARAFWIKRDALPFIINLMVDLLDYLLSHPPVTSMCIATMVHSLVWLSYRSETPITEDLRVKVRGFINAAAIEPSGKPTIQQLLGAVSFFDNGNLAHYPRLSPLVSAIDLALFPVSRLERDILDVVASVLPPSVTLKRQHWIDGVFTYVDGFISERKLVIQVDGKWHELPHKRSSNELCNELFYRHGYSVARIHWRDWERCDGDAGRQRKWLSDFLQPVAHESIRRPDLTGHGLFSGSSRHRTPPLPDRMPPPPGPRRK